MGEVCIHARSWIRVPSPCQKISRNFCSIENKWYKMKVDQVQPITQLPEKAAKPHGTRGADPECHECLLV